MNDAPATAPAQHPQPASRRRWPLLAIGASAGTATWSGWVGLGQLTGFGVVHPLPGIADALTINTAVTLPIGVEAYAMYALSIATSARSLPGRTRRSAWASSAAALLLGMAGQVAYHVMTARHSVTPAGPDRLAPWWVIALVSCLPVLVLGAASLLWHLAGSADPDPIPVPAGPDPILKPAADPVLSGTIADDQSRDATPTADDSDRATESSPAPGGRVQARPFDVARALAAIEAGDLPARPTASAIRALLAISPTYARAARDALNATAAPEAEGTSQNPEHDHQTGSSPSPTPQQQAEETPEDQSEQHIPPVIKNPEPRTQPLTNEEPIQKDEEVHTYASLIE